MLKSFWQRKKEVWGDGNIPMPPLNNFSDFFGEKIAMFVTLKKITRLNSQSNLKRKYRKC